MTPPSARTRYLLRPTSPADARARGVPQVLVYAALSVLALTVAEARGRSPIQLADDETWLAVPHPLAGHALSLALGAVLAYVTVKATPPLVRRSAWVRALHVDLRPAVRGAGSGTLLVLGVGGALAEELLFRGMLLTAVGLVLSSVAFGLLHQTRGRGRWIWAAWAIVMGLSFGAIFLVTGSLLGAIVAHAAINVRNLRFLRDTELPASPAPTA
ncbi:MAG: hypothetical protein JWP97_4954 [Labilithrix sp.]|nr:hypothetical protein [Labilithrix sp.]